ncbi:MAG: hypothetical protein ABIG64_09840 [Candidatus Omnitrophota bacterium]
MSQYAPCYKTKNFVEINRPLNKSEYDEIVEYVNACGFNQCWMQELESNKIYFPNFKSSRVF